MHNSPDGMRTAYHEEGEKIIVSYEQDVETVMKVNHEQRAATSRVAKKGDMHHVMRIPLVILQKIQNETGLDFFNPVDAKEILKILKRPEYACWRTYDGAI